MKHSTFYLALTHLSYCVTVFFQMVLQWWILSSPYLLLRPNYFYENEKTVYGIKLYYTHNLKVIILMFPTISFSFVCHPFIASLNIHFSDNWIFSFNIITIIWPYKLYCSSQFTNDWSIEFTQITMTLKERKQKVVSFLKKKKKRKEKYRFLKFHH